MKNRKLKGLLSLYAAPAVLCVLGLCLLLRPDSASALIARVLGWGLFALGVGCGISAIFGHGGTAVKILGTLVFLGLGGWLIRNPLALANAGGQFIGVLLITEGGQRVFRYGDKGWGLITIAAGAVLVFLPMIASRLVFSICGAVLLVVGVLMFIGRFHRCRLESGNDDPNIIDVDAL